MDGDLEDVFDQSEDSEARYFENQWKNNVESWTRTGYRDALLEDDNAGDDAENPVLQSAFDAGYRAANAVTRRISSHRTVVTLVCRQVFDKAFDVGGEDGAPPAPPETSLGKLRQLEAEWEKVFGDLHQLVTNVEELIEKDHPGA